jgi:hypothetical protein
VAFMDMNVEQTGNLHGETTTVQYRRVSPTGRD